MMPNPRPPHPHLMLTIVWLILCAGCDDEVAEVARQAADRQAQQNQAMAGLQESVARGAQELVTADARARREFFGVHRELQAERQRLGTNWDALETQRQHLAEVRRTESLLVPMLEAAGAVLVTVVLLAFLARIVAGSRTHESIDAELSELLVTELVDQLTAAATPPRLAAQVSTPTATLPPPDDPTQPALT